jgi:hypothetical protein
LKIFTNAKNALDLGGKKIGPREKRAGVISQGVGNCPSMHSCCAFLIPFYIHAECRHFRRYFRLGNFASINKTDFPSPTLHSGLPSVFSVLMIRSMKSWPSEDGNSVGMCVQGAGEDLAEVAVRSMRAKVKSSSREKRCRLQ